MIGPAELEDILLDLQAVGVATASSFPADAFHPNYWCVPDQQDGPSTAEKPKREPSDH
jgi:hypothetical protein